MMKKILIVSFIIGCGGIPDGVLFQDAGNQETANLNECRKTNDLIKECGVDEAVECNDCVSHCYLNISCNHIRVYFLCPNHEPLDLDACLSECQ